MICYAIGDSLYLNVTNRCTNRCSFCIRATKHGIGDGMDLWLKQEPTAAEIIADLEKWNAGQYAEAVFCGYGEPFLRADVCMEVARYIKERWHLPVRVNTNGHGNRACGRDITPELVGLFDTVSISLNAKDRAQYEALCACDFGEAGFDEMLDFAKKCKQVGLSVVLSVVDVISPADIEACRQIAADMGVTFRVRHMQGNEPA